MTATRTAGTAAPATERQPARRSWFAVLVLAFAAGIIVTTEFLPVGFLPLVAGELHVSLGTAGLLVLVPGLSAAVAAPLVIVAARRLDRRPVVIGLGALVLLSNALAAVAPSFGVLLIARVFLGIAIGGFWAVVPPLGFRLVGRRAGTRATAIILAGLSAGTVIGLPAGQFFGALLGWRETFAAAATVTALIVAAECAVLPRIAAAGRMTFGHLRGVLRVPVARVIVVAGTIATVGQFAASTFVTPYLLERVDLSSGVASLFFIGYGVAGIVGNLVGPRLVERDQMATFAGAALAFGAVLALLPALAGLPARVAVALAGWGVLWGLVPLALQTHMLSATPNAPEAGSAVLISVLQLAIAIGAGLGGVVLDSAGLTALFVSAGATAVVASLLGFRATIRKGETS
ncbi:MFS transporter [Asanoa siamensis]|uniref:MFS transporter n=1 Tax=Asanoa siamensis TaxID=926357 RepID=A0ABQ4CJG0_9ACTN|nr:MFS transporter [Asanoa siamensis]GIF71419.1 MFS transporter [Asanoa siamensis]